MKNLLILMLVVLGAAMLTACSKDENNNDPVAEGNGVITAVCAGEDIGFWLELPKNSKVNIDWGDGVVKEYMSVYDEEEGYYAINMDYTYSKKTQHTIKISGCSALERWNCKEKQLTSLDVSGCSALTDLGCYYNDLTSLDVSGCSALTDLGCYDNQLTSLDVSGCTKLTWLDCCDNQLSASALNKIYTNLPRVDEGILRAKSNPGYEASNKSIATNKGWRFSEYYESTF